MTVAREQIKLEYINIILGMLDQRSNLLIYFIILGKIYLWNCRKYKKIPFFLPFEDVVKRKYKTEKLISSQSILSLKQFQAKWNLVLNNNPIFPQYFYKSYLYCKGVSAACLFVFFSFYDMELCKLC